MILKIQRPIEALSSKGVDMSLVYNKSRHIEFMIPTKDVMHLFPPNNKITSYKVYVNGDPLMKKGGWGLIFHNHVEDQDW